MMVSRTVKSSVREVVLLEHGHARTGFDGNIARRRVQLARQDFQEGGLACAVCADDAVAVALGEFDVDFFEQRFSAKVQADVGYGNHSSSKSHYYESRYIISCFVRNTRDFAPFRNFVHLGLKSDIRQAILYLLPHEFRRFIR